MEIIATITQHELIFEPDQSLVGYQWSENLGIKVVYDETYDGWSVKWDAITSGHKNKRIPLAYDEETNTITLNKDCFEDDYLYIACAFISNGQIRNSAPIEFYIGESVNHGLETMPKVPGLYEEMQALFEQIFANEYKQPIDDLIERASDLETKTEELQTKAEAQQTQVDKAIANAGIATSAANTAASNATEKAQEANTAAQAATDLVSDITAKLEAGEFKGEKGDTGATGEKGDKGDKGDPGSRTLYGSGSPQVSDGNVGDWYYDTTSENWDVYYKSSETAWEKMGQIKGGGSGGIGGDTLPIGAMVPSALSTAPEGWLLCDGSEVSRTDYSELFHVIGESYGAGDGETTFTLPNEPNPLLYAKEGNMIQFMEREPALYMMIKAKQIVPVTGGIVNDAENESETDALSAKALKQIVSGLEQRLREQIVKPNLLINGDFRIRQRGETFTYSGGGSFMYMQDRWIFAGSQSGTFTIANDGSMAITTTPENTSTYRQYVELTPVLKRQIEEAQYKLTLSVGIDAMVEHQAGIRVCSSDVVSYPLEIGYNRIYHTFTLTEDDLKGTYLDVVVYAAIYPETSVTAIPVWAKLELGAYATPFIPRRYSDELMECMRYYQKVIYSYSNEFTEKATSVTVWNSVPLKIPMIKNNPTISRKNSTFGSDTINVKSINFYYYDDGSLNISITPTKVGFFRLYKEEIVLDAEIY